MSSNEDFTGLEDLLSTERDIERTIKKAKEKYTRKAKNSSRLTTTDSFKIEVMNYIKGFIMKTIESLFFFHPDYNVYREKDKIIGYLKLYLIPSKYAFPNLTFKERLNVKAFLDYLNEELRKVIEYHKCRDIESYAKKVINDNIKYIVGLMSYLENKYSLIKGFSINKNYYRESYPPYFYIEVKVEYEKKEEEG